MVESLGYRGAFRGALFSSGVTTGVTAALTHGNLGAYWESGFAEALGRPVILTCNAVKWQAEKTHFDTNHMTTIIWDPAKPTGAANLLTATIRASLPDDAKMSD